MRSAMLNKNSQDLQRAHQTRDEELEIMGRVDLVLSYNETEHVVLQSHSIAEERISKCPWVIETVGSIAPFKNRKNLAFLGGYGHPPNVEAVEFFCKEVMPKLAQVDPKIEFHIYGSNVPDWMYDLETDNVKIKGFVEDLGDIFQKYRLFVSPLLTGAGIKGKVLSCISYGCPSILSSISAEGIGLTNGN